MEERREQEGDTSLAVEPGFVGDGTTVRRQNRRERRRDESLARRARRGEQKVEASAIKPGQRWLVQDEKGAHAIATVLGRRGGMLSLGWEDGARKTLMQPEQLLRSKRMPIDRHGRLMCVDDEVFRDEWEGVVTSLLSQGASVRVCVRVDGAPEFFVDPLALTIDHDCVRAANEKTIRKLVSTAEHIKEATPQWTAAIQRVLDETNSQRVPPRLTPITAAVRAATFRLEQAEA